MRSSEALAGLVLVLLLAGCGGGAGAGSDGGDSGGSGGGSAGGGESGSGDDTTAEDDGSDALNPSSPRIDGVNVMRISVNGALCDDGTSSSYPNKPCVSVTVCEPGTETCQTVNDVLLDTGSYGLRVFASAVPDLSLAAIGLASSATLRECAYFADGTTLWGPVVRADVVLGEEDPVTVPVHLVGATEEAPCSTGDGTFAIESTPDAAGFHGILGIGPSLQDCGDACVTDDDMNYQYYYACKGSGASFACAPTTATLAQQVANPIALLSGDGNGYAIQLPAVEEDGATSATGNLVLGIDTRANNASSGAVALDLYEEFYLIAAGSSRRSTWSFLDTGSNGLFLASAVSGLSGCASSGWSSWYCPTSTRSLSATFTAYSGAASSVASYRIASALALDASGNMVFDDLGGPSDDLSSTAVCDWGLPFFLGRTIYFGITGKASNLGTGPYLAW